MRRLLSHLASFGLGVWLGGVLRVPLGGCVVCHRRVEVDAVFHDICRDCTNKQSAW